MKLGSSNKKKSEPDLSLYEDVGIDFLGLGRLYKLKQLQDNNGIHEEDIQAVTESDTVLSER